jgi:hypothetical protein
VSTIILSLHLIGQAVFCVRIGEKVAANDRLLENGIKSQPDIVKSLEKPCKIEQKCQKRESLS